VAAEGADLSAEQREKLGQLYGQLREAYPKSPAVQRIPLDFTVRSFGFELLEREVLSCLLFV